MRARVWMIDDNEDDLLFTRIALERCGVDYEVRGFERADGALRELAASQGRVTDLILLDINMPGMGGFDFLQAFEAMPATQRAGTAVVMLSSSSDPNDLRRAHAHASVRGFLTKPLERAAAAALRDLMEPGP